MRTAPLDQLRSGLTRLVPGQRSGPPSASAAAPRGDDPATGFERRPGTLWLEPRLLLQSALQVLVSGLLGRYQDKREQMGAVAASGYLDLSTDADGRTADEVWVDYVSDTGDGFDATYAVASLIGRPSLELDGVHAPRGRLLVMGGDQVYPAADVDEYEERLIGPYRAALPEVPDEPAAPYVQVVPGNHDWYDGLTAFMRTFCQRRWIGGWRSRQARSYFATKLPQGWWVWGLDIQFDTYIDDAQLQYFREVAQDLQPGDAVVLCSAKPSWVAATDQDVEAYAVLDFFERTVVRDRGAHVRVALSGDRHHYARYEAADGAQKITSGGGGAYLSSTHHLPEQVCVPPEESRARGKSACTTYRRAAVFPDAATSRRLGRGVLRLPALTPTFALLLGGVQALLGLAVGAALAPPLHGTGEQLAGWAQALRDASVGELAGGLAGTFTALGLSTLVVAAAVAFTGARHQLRPSPSTARLVGVLHGAAHLGLAVAVTAGAAAVTAPLPGAWMLAGFVPLVVVIGGLLGAELVALYLLAADRIGLNSNELFAAQGLADHKQFLRLHIGTDGALTVFPVGLAQVPRRWVNATGPLGPERIRPADRPLQPCLIEPPVRVARTPSAAGTA